MDDRDLAARLQVLIRTSTGYLGGQLPEDRRKAMRDYLGEPNGTEIEGRSQVISTDVQDVVEGLMPDLMQIFTSSDKAVRFAPTGPEDEEFADQASDYVNHIFYKDNDGFVILHDGIKDALLQITGVFKSWWDDTPVVERISYTALTDDQLTDLLDDEEIELIEHTEYVDEDAEKDAQRIQEEQGISLEEGEIEAIATLHDVTLKRTQKGGRVRIQVVAPEQFLISKRAESLKDAPFCAHWEQPTVSELIDRGYDPDQIESLPTADAWEFNEEKTQRFQREDEWSTHDEEIDSSMREIKVFECYVKVDWDGDGIAELRKITVAGTGYEILRWKDGTLDNEPIDEHPFNAITPIKMPHKFHGRSVAELVQDIQLIKTAIWRQLLDNMYQINNARAAVSKKVQLDDYLDNRVGGYVRVDTPGPDVAGHIQPIVTAPIGNQAYPLLEYVDTIRETRTGVNRLGQGVDPDALNSTATGINQLIGRSQQRTLLIAMVFAYTGIRDLFRRILKLTIMHQQKGRVIRLRNEWVEMDPRAWNAGMDVTVNVGLGRGTQENRIVSMTALLNEVKEVIAAQGGMQGPLVDWAKYRAALEEYAEAIGVRSLDPFMSEIKEGEEPEQQPNPAQQAAEAEQQAKDAEMQRDMERKEAESALKLKEAAEKAALDRQSREAELEARREERAIDLEFKEREFAMKREQWDLELAYKREMMGLDIAAKEQAIQRESKANGNGEARTE